MATRAITQVMDGSRALLCLYRQYDGYPTGHGAELLAWARGMRITAGIGVDEALPFANGMGCFAAQMVAHFKGNVPGHFYIMPSSTSLGRMGYAYQIQEQRGRLWLVLRDPDGVMLFSGYLDDFSPNTATVAGDIQ